MIIVNDMIYGEVSLPPVFEELLLGKTLQRLNHIHHSGAIFLVNPSMNHKRLEHAIGVMLLIRKLGGTEIEQLAGLLHDISHTAFSHVGDYVMNNTTETYHEQLFEATLLNSEIPDILYKYGYHPQQLLQENFPLLEQPLPLLCADRLDYTLRDALHARIITPLEARSLIAKTVVHQGTIRLQSQESADWINHIYKRLNKEVFHAPLYVYANQQLSILLQDMILGGKLSPSDLMCNDTELLYRINSSKQGYEGLKAIRAHEGYTSFLLSGPRLKIKKRHLDASFISYTNCSQELSTA